MRTWAIVGSGITALGLVARRSFMIVRVEGSSMLPTYADGDHLLAVRPPLGRAIRPGDVVVVVAPGPSPATRAVETLVKRVAEVEPARRPRQVFVVGDSGPSYDSRVFGPLASDAVLGRVVRVVSTG